MTFEARTRARAACPSVTVRKQRGRVWSDRELVQRTVAQQLREDQLWYAACTLEQCLLGSTHPISVAEWETQLTPALPQGLEGSLPTIEQVQAELSGDVGGRDE